MEVLNALPRRLCIIYSPPRVINHGLRVSLLPIYDRIANALRAAVSLWESRQRWREEPSPVQLRHGGGGDGEDEDNKRFTYMSIAPCRAPRQSRFVTHIDWWLETNLIEKKTLNEHILASHELVMLAAGCYDSTGQFLRARICA